eukprot:TRINITY_DN12238_c0_g3_i1.p1 TRINITY_DN12238_c0_g3~~TRINITY_DN12238_c0_g3_i1.p1  ORF type:complete len:236 (+),score=71.72 TRINITY_DN12238_c0_g3_i1:106-813(+)
MAHPGPHLAGACAHPDEVRQRAGSYAHRQLCGGMLQLVLGAGLVPIALLSPERRTARDFGAAVVCCPAALLGIAGAVLRAASAVRLYLVMQVWALTVLTIHLSTAVAADSAAAQSCAPSISFGYTTAECDDRRIRTQFEIALAAVGIANAIVSVPLAQGLHEALGTLRSGDKEDLAAAAVLGPPIDTQPDYGAGDEWADGSGSADADDPDLGGPVEPQEPAEPEAMRPPMMLGAL